MAEAAAQRVIDTREELINALTEAAEIEHGLLIQYLFAAYSLKRRPSEGITEAQVELARDWERAILVVARQEMAHLGNVCNLVTAVGGSPRFGRPNFPQAMNRYYPFDFQLERFSEASLDRFIAFEEPADQQALKLAAIDPDPVDFDKVGVLYRKIARGFKVLDDAYGRRREALFIGPSEAQDADSWTQAIGPGGFNISPVTDLVSALATIDLIVQEGEGDAENRDGSHYNTFVSIRRDFLEERRRSPGFDPARPVVPTPLTRLHRDAGPGPHTLLTPGTAAYDTAALFNQVYATVLLMLVQFYDFGGESRQQRMGVQASIRQTMSAAVRPLAEVLTELPVGDAGGTAGPGFELYGVLQVPSHLPSRWTQLRERFEVAAGECRRLGTTGLTRLPFVARNLELLGANIARLEAEG